MIVGVCDVSYSTNAFMANSFEELGHTVIKYNYRTRLKNLNGNVQELGKDFIYTLEHINEHTKIDLVIFCKTDSMPIDAMEEASKITNTFYWFMDPLTTAKIIMADMRAYVCRGASATCMEVVDFFKNCGQPNSFKINEGVDLEIYKNLYMDKTNDVLFVGSPTNERAKCIDFLVNNGISVKVFGQGWHGSYKAGHPIYNTDLAHEINKSKIVLNVSRTNSYSDRVTLSMACGAFVLTSDVPEIHNDFVEDMHLSLFNGPQDLYKKVSHFLAKDNCAEREGIAEAGSLLVRNRSSWERTCEHILEVACI